MTTQILVNTACEVVGFVATVWSVGMFVARYPHLPEQVANHFNLRGEPVQWSPKALLWIMPGMSAVFFVLQTALNPTIAPYLPGRPDAPTSIWMPVPLTACICLLTLIQREVFSVALGAERANIRLVLAGTVVMLAAVGFVFVQAMLSIGTATAPTPSAGS